MTDVVDLPAWAAIIVGLCSLVGAAFTLTGCIGLIRLERFYERVHAPTLGTSMGMAFILLASMLYFTVGGGRPVVHEILIAIFVTVTTPVTLMLLVRAARYRELAEGQEVVTSIGEPQDGSGEPRQPD